MEIRTQVKPFLFLSLWLPLWCSAQTILPDTLVHINGERTPVLLSRIQGQRLFFRDATGWKATELDSLNELLGKGMIASQGQALIAQRKGRELVLAIAQRQDLDRYSRSQFSDYQPLQSTGLVPLDLREYYLEASEHEVQGRQEKKTRFVQENTVAMGYLFASGRVLYNDPLSNYGAAVLDTLLQDNKALRDRLRVFCIRSTGVNAYTTNDGKIFLTLGLLARLRSRAELAFVLAHEVQHYLHGDVYGSFVLNRQLNKRMRTVGKNQETAEQLLRSRFRRSRQHEITADSCGILLYHDSPFGVHDPDHVFDVLAFSERAIYNEAPGGDFFCSAHGYFDESFSVAPVDLALTEHRHDTVFATHPAIDERRAMLRSMSTGQAWDVMEQDDSYAPIRTMAGFELAYTYYIDADHERALIQVNGLLADHPNNRFLMELSVKSLQALAERAGTKAKADSVALSENVSDPVTVAFKNAIGRMTDLELYAAVVHRYAHIPNADEDLDLRYCASKATKALRSSGLMPKVNAPSTTRPIHMEKDQIEISTDPPSDPDGPSVDREQDQLETGELLLSDVKAAMDSLLTPRMTSMLAALMTNPVAADLLEPKDVVIAGIPSGATYQHGHLVIPFILILDTLGRPHALEPQQVVARYCRAIEQPGSNKLLRVKALSSFGLDSIDTHEYNDFCFYQDQLQAFLTSDDHPLVLDRDQLKFLGERYDARYLTLSFVLMTKNKFTFKLGRWLIWGFLIPGGAGLAVGSHSLLYKYTGKQFTVVYDLWTGEEISTGYARKRSYMSAHPSRKKFEKSIDPDRR